MFKKILKDLLSGALPRDTVVAKQQCTTIFITIISLAMTSNSFANIEINRSKQKLTTTRQNLNKLNLNIKQQDQQSKQLSEQLRQADQQISVLTKALYQLQQKLALDQQQYQKLQLQYEIAKSKFSAQQQILAKQFRLQYSLGDLPQLKILLDNQDPQQIARLTKYYQYIGQQQHQKLVSNQQILAETLVLQDQVQQKIASIKTARILQANKLSKINTSKRQRQILLTNIAKAIAKDQHQLQILQRDEQALETKIAQLNLSKVSTRANKNNKIISNKELYAQFAPVQPIINKSAKVRMYQISKAAANRFVIQAVPGTTVHAVNHGKVIFADWLRGYGLLLIIAHNNDIMSLYGHNQTLFKKVGDVVKQGDPIALVGQSGGQALPGLYFEIRKATKSVNVQNWFNYETI